MIQDRPEQGADRERWDRKSERLHALPFIFYTSTYTSPDKMKLAQTVGADKYLIKPATTATVLAHAIVREGSKSVAAGMNPMDLKRGVEKAVDILRLPGIYGPGRNALVRFAQGDARRIVKPGHVSNRAHVDDIAEATRLVLTSGLEAQIWNVADDEPAGWGRAYWPFGGGARCFVVPDGLVLATRGLAPARAAVLILERAAA